MAVAASAPEASTKAATNAKGVLVRLIFPDLLYGSRKHCPAAASGPDNNTIPVSGHQTWDGGHRPPNPRLDANDPPANRGVIRCSRAEMSAGEPCCRHNRSCRVGNF